MSCAVLFRTDAPSAADVVASSGLATGTLTGPLTGTLTGPH
jgi:hypothetical protein